MDEVARATLMSDSFLNGLDQQVQNPAPASQPRPQAFLGSLDNQAMSIMKSAGQDVPIQSPDTSAMQNVGIGFGHGMERGMEGAGQFSDFLLKHFGNSLPTSIKLILGLSSKIDSAVAPSTPSDVDAEENTYKRTPASQTFAGKAGNFTAQALPYLFGPEATAAPGAGLIHRAALGAISDAGTGTLIGAGQPVGNSDSRLTNSLAYGAGAGATSFAGRLLAGITGNLASKLPWFKNGVARYQVGQFLNEQAGKDIGPQTESAVKAVQNVVPGYQPTTAGLTKNLNLGAWERTLAQNPTIKLPTGQSPQTAFLERGMQNRSAITNALGKFGDVQAPETDLSQNVGATLNDIVKAAQDKEDAIWNNKDFLKLPVNITRVKGGVQNWMDSLPVDDASSLPNDIIPRIQAIQTKYGPTAPFNEIKVLRSNLLRESRALEATQPTQSRLLSQAAGTLMSNLGNGEGFSPAEQAAGDAFRQASDFTRQMHATLDPLQNAISKAETEESSVGRWMINPTKPIPERTDAFVTAGQKYLDNADTAPQAARDYLVNAITNAPSVTPKNPNAPVSSAGLGKMLKNNWSTIQKLFPSQAQQDLLRGIQATSEMGDFAANLKPQDMGPDTSSKLLANMWISQSVGDGVRLGDIWGKGLGWAMTQDPATRQAIFAQALLDPKKAALLKMNATGPMMKFWTNAFGIAGKASSAATANAGAQFMKSMTQPETKPKVSPNGP